MKIVIIDYKAGNVRSVDFALQRLGVQPILSADKETLLTADKIIFPGVGHAYSAMQELKKNNLDLLIPSFKQPVLGICLGMQLLCAHTEEGNTKGLGIFDTRVRKFDEHNSTHEKVPHMGWNTTQNVKGKLFKEIEEDAQFYYVHSYYAQTCEATIATCEYMLPFSAALQKDNFYAAQFHPEKSATVGEKLLQNFLTI